MPTTVNGTDRWLTERRNRIKLEGAIRRLQCPFCGAQVGESCHSRISWYETSFHADRRKAAQS